VLAAVALIVPASKTTVVGAKLLSLYIPSLTVAVPEKLFEVAVAIRSKVVDDGM
jgi:hypothetical protein